MIKHKYQPTCDGKIKIVSDRGKELVINCTLSRYQTALAEYKASALMQDAFLFLSHEEREFLITGIDPLEWQTMCDEIEADEAYDPAHPDCRHDQDDLNV